MIRIFALAISQAPPLLPKNVNALSTPMQIVILMTALTMLPAIIMSITPFLRISIVLHFLRQEVPKNWAAFCDSVTDNFRVINPADFRVLKA